MSLASIATAVAPTLIGSIGGGLVGGLLGGKTQAPAVTPAKKIDKFAGALGTATDTGFTYQDPLAAQNKLAADQLTTQLAQGVAYDPAQAGQYQQAYLASRQPALEQNLQQQRQKQQASIGASGMAGSSGAAYQQALQNQFANQQRSTLTNEAVLGGQQLAQQDLQNKLASSGFLSNLTQQGLVNNPLAAQGTTAQNRVSSQASAIDYANQISGQNQQQFLNQAALDQQRLQNITGGAAAGAKLGQGLYDTAFKSGGAKSGGGGANSGGFFSAFGF